MYSVNNSKKYWGDPEVFRPERFLDNQGCLMKDERLIPFGIGKRVCLGESLAKMSLFLYFTTIIKHFKFETVPGHLDPSTDPLPGLTFSPKPYNVVVTQRVR
jgi:methyl farnesoate epoxidase/farnesoate epoxidase